MYLINYPLVGDPEALHILEPSLVNGVLSVGLDKSTPGSAPVNAVPITHIVPTTVLQGDPLVNVADWLVSPAGPYPGAVLVSDADVVDRLRELALLLKIRLQRDRHRDSGCIVPTPDGPKVIDTDINSRLNIVGSVSMSTIIGEAFTVTWRMMDNSLVVLNATQMMQIGVAVGQFVDLCQQRKNALDALVSAGELDQAEAELYTGWPQ